MRKPVIAGNWKMHKTRDEALQFIYSVNQEVPDKEFVDTVVAPQDPVLRDLVKRQGDNLRISAQNMHEKTEGAFTGETSAAVLENLGVEYVIIGHSERRAMFNDTDERVNKKLHQAFRYGITPILCVGESLETREAGETDMFVKGQVKNALKGLGSEQVKSLIIAYEPIWAIGTGKTATSDQAEETIKMIRETLSTLYDASVGDETRILYGGSVKPANIDELMAQENIDGALVGGASLDPKSFLTLVEAANKK
ncbi:MAG: triose-phosphate isomerase [Bacillota bacterium]